MLVGILSDSHGRTDTTAAAVRALAARGVEVMIHLGDVGTDEVLEELTGHHAAYVVFGNCDANTRALSRHAERLGINVAHPLGRIEVEGKSIAFAHGHEEHLLTDAIAANVDYILHGHTHETRDERIGPTRIVNPGALHRAARYTVAILDPSTDRLEFIEVAAGTAR